MIWPWVPREQWELAVKRADEYSSLATRALGAVEQSMVRYDALLDKYHHLRLRGAEPFAPSQATFDRKPFDPLAQAVNAAAQGKSPAVRSQMLRRLALDRKAVELGTLGEDELLERITVGESSDTNGLPE